MKLRIWFTEKDFADVKQIDVFTFERQCQVIFVYKNKEYTIKGRGPEECGEKLKEMINGKIISPDKSKWPGMT